MKYINFASVSRTILALAITCSLSAGPIQKQEQQATAQTTQRSVRPDRPSGNNVAIPVNVKKGEFETLTVTGNAKILGDLLVCGHIPRIETCLEQLLSCCEFLSSVIETLQTPMCCPPEFCEDFSTFTVGAHQDAINAQLATRHEIFSVSGSALSCAGIYCGPIIGHDPNAPGFPVSKQLFLSDGNDVNPSPNLNGGSLTLTFSCPVVIDSLVITFNGMTLPGGGTINYTAPVGSPAITPKFLVPNSTTTYASTISGFPGDQQLVVLAARIDYPADTTVSVSSICYHCVPGFVSGGGSQPQSGVDVTTGAPICCRSFCIGFQNIPLNSNDTTINMLLANYPFFGIPNCAVNCVGSTLVTKQSALFPTSIYLAQQPNSGNSGPGLVVNPTGGTLGISFFPCPQTLDSITLSVQAGSPNIIGAFTIRIKDNTLTVIRTIVGVSLNQTETIPINQAGAFAFEVDVTNDTGILDFCVSCPEPGVQALSCCEELRSIIDSLNTCCPRRFCIDFQKFNVGDTTGTINAGLVGITLSATSTCGNGLIIFDSSNPGTGNEALGSPNQDCSATDFCLTNSCPGIGSGGAPGGMCPNCSPLGKVLILSDNGALSPCVIGGTITLTFTCPVIFEEIGLLNIDNDCNTLEFFDSNGNLITTQAIPNCCPNGYQVVTTHVTGVKSVNVNLCTMAAITHFCFECEVIDVTARSCCEALSSIIETIETRIENLESCCEQNSREISILDVCCQESRSCCERVTSIVDNIETIVSLLDLCCLANLSCCENLQSQIDQLNCPQCCPREFCLDFNTLPLGTTAGLINTNPRFCGVTVSASPAGTIKDITNCVITGPILGGCFNGIVPTRGFALPLSGVSPCEMVDGVITISFACPVVLDDIGIINIDLDVNSAIQLVNSAGVIFKTIPIPAGDATLQDIVIKEAGVKSVNIVFNGDAALACLCFHCEVIDESSRSCCEGLNTRVEALESCCEEVRSIVDIFETRIEQVESCCEETRRCCSAFEIVINNFISEFELIETRIENLESCCEENRTAIDNLVSCCDNHETRIENLESCCDRVSSIIDELLCPRCCPQLFCIDFEQFSNGQTQDAINNKLCGLTITGEGNNCAGPQPCQAMIYDSNLPVPIGLNAANLGTPNVANGGPGQEEGGNNTNTAAQGNVLIISDGSGNIQANGNGGTLTFTFTCAVIVDNIGFLDGELPDDQPAVINLFGVNNALIATIPIPGLGDNTFQIVPINIAGVKRMEVSYTGIAAITNVCFHCEVIDIAARSCCDFLSSVVEFQQTEINNLISCCDNHETRIENLESCCENVSSLVNTFETRIETLESCCEQNSNAISILDVCCAQNTTCCDNLTSRIEVLECPSCCPKTFCIDFSRFTLGDSQVTVNNTLCGVTIFATADCEGCLGSVIDVSEFDVEGPISGGCLTQPTSNIFGVLNDGSVPSSSNFNIDFACPVVLQNIGVVALGGTVADITLLGTSGVITTTTVTLDFGYQVIPINQTGVTSVSIVFTGPGALACFCFNCEVIDLAARSCCDALTSVVEGLAGQVGQLQTCCDASLLCCSVNSSLITELFSIVDNLQTCSNCVATGIEQLQSCCDNHETRIEALESCCEDVRSRLDALECPSCCPKRFCVDFSKFTAGDTDEQINAGLCGLTVSNAEVFTCATIVTTTMLPCLTQPTSNVLFSVTDNPITFRFDCDVFVENIGVSCLPCPFTPAGCPTEIALLNSNEVVITTTTVMVEPGTVANVTINQSGVRSIQIINGQPMCLCFHCETVDTTARSLIDLQQTEINNLQSCCDEVRSRLDVLESPQCCQQTFCVDFANTPENTVNPSFNNGFTTITNGTVVSLCLTDSLNFTCLSQQTNQALLTGPSTTINFACPVMFKTIGLSEFCPTSNCDCLITNIAVTITLKDSNGNQLFQAVLAINPLINPTAEVTFNQPGVSSVEISHAPSARPLEVVCFCFECETIDTTARSLIDNLEDCCIQNISCCEELRSRVDRLEGLTSLQFGELVFTVGDMNKLGTANTTIPIHNIQTGLLVGLLNTVPMDPAVTATASVDPYIALGFAVPQDLDPAGPIEIELHCFVTTSTPVVPILGTPTGQDFVNIEVAGDFRVHNSDEGLVSGVFDNTNTTGDYDLKPFPAGLFDLLNPIGGDIRHKTITIPLSIASITPKDWAFIALRRIVPSGNPLLTEYPLPLQLSSVVFRYTKLN